MKNYTQEWNVQFKNNVKGLGKFDLCLEIGCFEGMTTNYIIENLLLDNGKIICVDPFFDTYLIDAPSLNESEDYFVGQYERFIENTKEHYPEKIELYRDLSSNVYKKLLSLYSNKISFIYIDGDHRPDAVYEDAINCFRLCKSEGLILFDDYKWKDTHTGIDKFLQENTGKFHEISKNDQLLIKKI